MNRREFLAATAAGTLATATNAAALPPVEKKYNGGKSPWPICLNASTIRPTPFLDKIKVAEEAGYDALELWVNELEEYEKGGGNLVELGKEIRDRGMFVINIIGMWKSMPEPKSAFEESLEESKNQMRMAAAVGSKHIAALPLPDRVPFDLDYATDCYRTLLEIGIDEFDIRPSMEFVSVFKGGRKLSQAAYIAIEADNPEASVVADTFHLFNAASTFTGVRHLQGKFISTFHWNDVPKGAEPNTLSDADRIYPGDGMLPLVQLLRDLREIEYFGPLSVEMFNREQWKQDPKVVLATAKDKMQAQVDAALG